jgi:methionine-rich copper-binding protein CopC
MPEDRTAGHDVSLVQRGEAALVNYHVRLDDRLSDRKADAEAMDLGADEGLKEMRRYRGGKACARVGHGEFDLLAAGRTRRNGELAAIAAPHRFETVANEVEQYPLDLHAVDEHRREWQRRHRHGYYGYNGYYGYRMGHPLPGGSGHPGLCPRSEFKMKLSQPLWAAALVATFTLGGIADARPRLLAATPAANAAVASPHRVQLTFSERLIGRMSGADILMTGMPGRPHHQPVKMGGFAAAIGADGKTLVLARQRSLPVGTYRVVWHAVATDTHRVAGAYSFAVK